MPDPQKLSDLIRAIKLLEMECLQTICQEYTLGNIGVYQAVTMAKTVVMSFKEIGDTYATN